MKLPLNLTGIVPLKLSNFFSILFENTVDKASFNYVGYNKYN